MLLRAVPQTGTMPHHLYHGARDELIPTNPSDGRIDGPFRRGGGWLGPVAPVAGRRIIVDVHGGGRQRDHRLAASMSE